MARIDRLFDELLARKGSDLHLGIGHPPLARVHGELLPLREAAVDRAEMEGLLFELTTAAQKKRIEGELDLEFSYDYEQKARLRANYFYKSTGLAAVFRVIPANVLTLAELGCPEIVRRLADKRGGLVLVAGPTASGKSTTLAAMIDHVNATRACHILTVEDPVEFVHEPKLAQITHREIGPHAPGFAAAVRSAGREDAQVVLVSELPDHETTREALSLANQGVLVFGSIRASSAARTIERIVAGSPTEQQPLVRGMMADSLAGIVVQRLLRTKDGLGRVAAFEVLAGSGAVSAIIRENKTSQIPSLMQAAHGAAGMQTMDMALERLLGQGKISPEDALEVAADKEAFARVIGRARPEPAEGDAAPR